MSSAPSLAQAGLAADEQPRALSARDRFLTHMKRQNRRGGVRIPTSKRADGQLHSTLRSQFAVPDQGARDRRLAERDMSRVPVWAHGQKKRPTRHAHLAAGATPAHLQFALGTLQRLFRKRAKTRNVGSLDVMSYIRRYADATGEITHGRFIDMVHALQKGVDQGTPSVLDPQSARSDTSGMTYTSNNSSTARTDYTFSSMCSSRASGYSNASGYSHASASGYGRSSSGFLRRSTSRLAYTPRQHQRHNHGEGANRRDQSTRCIAATNAPADTAAAAGAFSLNPKPCTPRLGHRELQQLFYHLDADNSGHVSVEELQLAITGPLPSARREAAMRTFNKLDLDGSGTIESAELRKTLSTAARAHPLVVGGVVSRKAFVEQELRRLQTQIENFGSRRTSSKSQTQENGETDTDVNVGAREWEAHFREVSAALPFGSRGDAQFNRVIEDGFNPSCPRAVARAEELAVLRARARAKHLDEHHKHTSGAAHHAAHHKEVEGLVFRNASSGSSSARSNRSENTSARSGSSRAYSVISRRDRCRSRPSSVGSARSSMASARSYTWPKAVHGHTGPTKTFSALKPQHHVGGRLMHNQTELLGCGGKIRKSELATVHSGGMSRTRELGSTVNHEFFEV